MIQKIVTLIQSATSDDPEVVRRWRLALTLTVIVLSLITVAFLGAFQKIGISRVAFAEDVHEEIDTKIEQALIPLNSELSTQGTYLKRLVRKDVTEELYEKQVDLCQSESAARKQELRDEIVTLQKEYRDVTGSKQNYDLPDCDEL